MIKEKNWADTTMNHFSTSARSFFQWLAAYSFLRYPVWESIPYIKIQEPKQIEVLDDSEILKIETWLRDLPKDGTISNQFFNIRLKLLYSLAIKDGIRAGELSRIMIDDIHIKDKEKRIVEIIVRGKGNRNRNIFLHRDSSAILFEYLEKRKEYQLFRIGKEDFVKALIISSQVKPANKRSVQEAVHQLGKKAGLDKPIWPHKLRKTAISNYVASQEENPDERFIFNLSLQMGNSPEVIQKHYVKSKQDASMAVKDSYKSAA